MARGNVVKDPEGDSVVLVDVGHAILYEDDHIRVWEIVLAPGEQQPWHRHHHPYLVVALEAADNRIEWLDRDEPLDVHEAFGRVIYRDSGEVHRLINRGPTTYRSRLVELKEHHLDG